jgi:phosphoribosylaminoimidazole-succinocarboxamide synthase
MRGFLTGTTSTSIWTNYSKGIRNYCGHILPENMIKNQPLDTPLLTPTTKDEHDELISADEIIASGRMSSADWEVCKEYSTRLFHFSQQRALEKGLILVDTKYEFGKDAEGNIVLVDEIQTPDSSRYWISATFADRLKAGLDPENIDKEFLRKWFVDRCDPYNDEVLPDAPPDLVNELSRRYIMLYEILTGKEFDITQTQDINECLSRIQKT